MTSPWGSAEFFCVAISQRACGPRRAGVSRRGCAGNISPPRFTKIDGGVTLLQILPKPVEGALVSVQIKHGSAAGLTPAAGAPDSRPSALQHARREMSRRRTLSLMPVPVKWGFALTRRRGPGASISGCGAAVSRSVNNLLHLRENFSGIVTIQF